MQHTQTHQITSLLGFQGVWETFYNGKPQLESFKHTLVYSEKLNSFYSICCITDNKYRDDLQTLASCQKSLKRVNVCQHNKDLSLNLWWRSLVFSICFSSPTLPLTVMWWRPVPADVSLVVFLTTRPTATLSRCPSTVTWQLAAPLLFPTLRRHVSFTMCDLCGKKRKTYFKVTRTAVMFSLHFSPLLIQNTPNKRCFRSNSLPLKSSQLIL